METIWIATGNEHKRQEFEEMLGKDVQVRSLRDLSEDIEIEETGTTFQENALIKARKLHEILKEAVIADDSGLEVDAMDKGPGVYSSRFMGEDTSYDIKNQYIIDTVKGKERTARFVCSIAWIEKDGTEHVYTGVMEGLINNEIKGTNGFGYDPIFYYPPFGTTNADVPAEQKNACSHRRRALDQFLADYEIYRKQK